MGMMTDITILNDGFDRIKKNPEAFVDAIGVLMSYGMDRHLEFGGHVAEARRNAYPHVIHRAHHADETSIMYSGQNMSMYLDRWSFMNVLEGMEKNEQKRRAEIYLGMVKEAKHQLRNSQNYLKEILDS